MTKPDWEIAWEKLCPDSAAHLANPATEPRLLNLMRAKRQGFSVGYLARNATRVELLLEVFSTVLHDNDDDSDEAYYRAVKKLQAKYSQPAAAKEGE